MKIQVPRDDLEAALQVARIGLASGSTSGVHDLSTHFLFRVREGKVEILASNGQRIFASVPLFCSLTGEEGDAFTVEGWRLLRWVSNARDGKPLSLEFIPEDAQVKAGSSKATLTWSSLDPAKFPYWDKTLESSEKIVEMEAHRFLTLVQYAKEFVGDQDVQIPMLAAMEFRGGSLFATDQKAICVLTPQGMEKSALRVHGKDAPALVGFLSNKDTKKIEILEHDRCLFIRREDGAILGVARWSHAFPELKIKKEEDTSCSWTVSTSDLQSGIDLLSCSADKKDTRIYFRFDDGKVQLSVDSTAGGKDHMFIPCSDHKGMDELPEQGFSLSSTYIKKVVDQTDCDELKFDIQWDGKNGYVRFHHAMGGDDFLAIVVWHR